MTERMQMLPLLQGLTLADFDSIIASVKLDFHKYDADDIIATSGDRCQSLIYIIDGRFEAEYRSATQPFAISETCTDMPHLIEPHNLFGVKRTFERTYTFIEEGSTFVVSRDHFLRRLMAFDIVRSNYINMLCNNLRKSRDAAPFVCPATAEEKILKLISSHCLTPTGEKHVRAKMEAISSMVDETRLTVSGILNKWQDQGLIDLRRHGFTIHELSNIKTNE